MGHKGFTYHFTQKRNGVVVDEWDAENLIPDEGVEYILGAALLPGVAKINSWYAGLWAGAYQPTGAVAASTLLSVATEVTAYSPANRVAFSPSSVAGGDASATQSYTFTDRATLNGAFVSSSSAKNSETGVLVSVVRFGAERSVLSGDTLDVTNTVSLG